jgi:hypothetical protein
VNREERSDRCDGRYNDFRSGAIVGVLYDVRCGWFESVDGK